MSTVRFRFSPRSGERSLVLAGSRWACCGLRRGRCTNERAGPQHAKRRGLDPATRGVIVLVVVVVLGLALLAKAAPSSSTSTAEPDRSDATSTTSEQTTTTRPVTTTTKPPATHPVAQVKVLVLNGSGGIPKIAGSNTEKVEDRGYDALPPGNAVARPATAVFFAPGYEGDALEVAKVLGLAPTVVAALPSPPPSPDASEANVVVVLGKDAPAAP